MRLLIGGALAALILATSVDASSGRGFAEEVETRAKADGFSGVILIADGKHIRHRAAYGYADTNHSVRMREDSAFRIASVTKLFTAAAILSLVEDGAVRLDDPIAAYLPDYPGAGASEVTLRQLLNHTSGLRQFDTVSSYQDAFTNGIPQYQRPLTTHNLLEVCCSGPLANAPGDSFDYNNADYIVLARIIERVTGRSFGGALTERIITPLNLTRTGMLDWAHSPKGLTSTYFFRSDTNELVNDMPVYWENWDGAGGMYSTADDLRVFADALFGGRLFDMKLVGELLAPGLDEYGLGLWSYSFEAAGKTWRVAKRPGSIMGANAMLYRLIDLNATIILLANTNRTDLDELAQEIAEELIDRRH